MDARQPAPCPFCGSEGDLLIVVTLWGAWRVKCRHCLTIGPRGSNSREGAVAQWDRRVVPAVAAAGPGRVGGG